MITSPMNEFSFNLGDLYFGIWVCSIEDLYLKVHVNVVGKKNKVGLTSEDLQLTNRGTKP